MLRRDERGRGRPAEGAEHEVRAGEGDDDDEQDKDAVKGGDERVDVVVQVALERGRGGIDAGFEVGERGGERGSDVVEQGRGVGAGWW